MFTLTRKAAAVLAAAALGTGMTACGESGDADEGTPAEEVAPAAEEQEGAVQETTEEGY